MISCMAQRHHHASLHHLFQRYEHQERLLACFPELVVFAADVSMGPGPDLSLDVDKLPTDEHCSTGSVSFRSLSVKGITA